MSVINLSQIFLQRTITIRYANDEKQNPSKSTGGLLIRSENLESYYIYYSYCKLSHASIFVLGNEVQ